MGLKQGRERCGSVLVLVLVVMATLFTVGGALTMLALTETAIAHNQEQELKLYYITEAGIEAGMAALNNCFEYSEEITGELGGGCYRVVIRQGPVMRGDQHYDFLGDVSFDSVTQRLVIATGSLGGLQMAMAVIAESTPLAGKALAVSNRLALEESTINGGVHCGEILRIRGENYIYGELRCTAPEKTIWEGPGEAAVTVIAVADSGSPGEPVTITTYSEGNPLPGVLRAKAPVLPPLVPDDFLSGAAVIYTSSERWGRLPAQCDHVDSIVVRGDLVIEPGRGDRFAISEKIVIIEGDLEIAAERAAVIANCIFVVGGSVTVTGSVSADSAAGKSRVMILSGRDIDLTGAKTDLEGGDQLFGSALLLYSKGEVVVGNRGFNGELKVKGAIIARELLLQRCTLDYCPEIYAEYCKTMSLGVVIKEWIRPWKL
jgi:hypothetical protein